MLDSFKRLVLITGCQRSGTTLLGQIFGAHPNAFMVDEPDGLYRWFDAFVEQAPGTEMLWRKMLIAADEKHRPGHRRLKPVANGKPAECRSGITHLVLKAPNLLYDYQAIAGLKLPVSVVYPVRDPRSVVASMTKLDHIPMIEKQVSLIRRHPDLAAELADDLNQLTDEAVPVHVRRAIVWRIKSTMQDRFEARGLPVLSFRYEDFVADAPAFCPRIAKHAGLTPDPAMLSHQSTYRGFGPGMTERARPVDGKSLATWSERLSSDQQQDILRITGAEMKALGYEARPDARPAVKTMAIADEVLRAPLVLAGRGGSGTRLLTDIAQAHDVFLGNRLNVSGDSVEWVDLIYEMVINHQNGKMPHSGWDALLRKKARIILGHGEWRAHQPWGWKLPETMVVVPEVFKAFPDARLIHLTRHPVVSAFRRTHLTSRANNPVGRAVLHAAYARIDRDPALIAEDEEYMHNAITWLYQVGRVARFGRDQLSPEQYLEIRFEDVCSAPENVSARISKFTGLLPVEIFGEGINKHRAAVPVPDDERVDRVWQICGQVAQELGYSMTVPAGAGS